MGVAKAHRRRQLVVHLVVDVEEQGLGLVDLAVGVLGARARHKGRARRQADPVGDVAQHALGEIGIEVRTVAQRQARIQLFPGPEAADQPVSAVVFTGQAQFL